MKNMIVRFRTDRSNARYAAITPRSHLPVASFAVISLHSIMDRVVDRITTRTSIQFHFRLRGEPRMGRQAKSSRSQDQEMFGKGNSLHEAAVEVDDKSGSTVPPIQVVAKHDEGAESDDSSVTLTNGRKERHQPKDHFMKPYVKSDRVMEWERQQSEVAKTTVVDEWLTQTTPKSGVLDPQFLKKSANSRCWIDRKSL